MIPRASTMKRGGWSNEIEPFSHREWLDSSDYSAVVVSSAAGSSVASAAGSSVASAAGSSVASAAGSSVASAAGSSVASAAGSSVASGASVAVVVVVPLLQAVLCLNTDV